MLPQEQAALLPEEIRSDPSFQQFNDIGSVAKSYLETKSMVGRSIQLPVKESKPEDIEKWHGETSAKLKDHGYTVAKLSDAPPQTPDAYDFKVDGVDPAAIKSDMVVQSFRPLAHKLGINNETANQLIGWYNKEVVPMLSEKLNAGAVEMIEDAAALEKIHNKEFEGEAKQAIEMRDKARLLLKKDIPELEDFLSGTAPYGGPWMDNANHPAMIKLLKFVAEAKQPDFGGHLDTLSQGDTMESVESDIDKLRKEADATTDQIQRSKIGEKMIGLYRKKDLLSRNMKKAS